MWVGEDCITKFFHNIVDRMNLFSILILEMPDIVGKFSLSVYRLILVVLNFADEKHYICISLYSSTSPYTPQVIEICTHGRQ